jgi:hypothetical protein
MVENRRGDRPLCCGRPWRGPARPQAKAELALRKTSARREPGGRLFKANRSSTDVRAARGSG